MGGIAHLMGLALSDGTAIGVLHLQIWLKIMYTGWFEVGVCTSMLSKPMVKAVQVFFLRRAPRGG